MREMKFRVGSRTNRTVYEPFTLREAIAFQNREPSGEDYCQFTGLKDKHGNPIYEGDIVRWEGYKGTVAFWTGGRVINPAGYYVECGDGFIHLDDTYEVIGNIYENPELLEAAQKGAA